MRWRIPILISLALFVAVSCDQQPLEPPTDEAAATPLFAPQTNANKWVEHWDEAWTEPCSGDEMDVTFVGWGQFMEKKGNGNPQLHVFHGVFTYSYNGNTFIFRDVGPDRFYCDDSACYVAISGKSSASGTANRDEINIGHAVMLVEEPGAWPALDVLFIAGRGLGVLSDLACDALM